MLAKSVSNTALVSDAGSPTMRRRCGIGLKSVARRGIRLLPLNVE